MKTSLTLAIISAGLALIASSCHNDHDEIQLSKDAIGFTANVPQSSRTNSSTLDRLDDFTAHVFTNGKEYMVANVKRQGTAWTYEPVKYWPSSGQINVFAYSPTDISTTQGSGLKRGDLTGYEDVGNVDMLYAVSINASKPDDSVVKLNFRHALSQVVITAKAEDPDDYKVVLHEVALCNIYAMGTFNFPRISSGTNSSDSTAVGEWISVTDLRNPLTVWRGEQLLTDDATPVLSNGGYEFVIPQTFIAFNSANPSCTSCLRVKADIYEVGTNNKVWSADDEHGRDQYIYYPLDIDQGNTTWDIGHRYKYDLEVGVPANGNVGQGVTVTDYPAFQIVK